MADRKLSATCREMHDSVSENRERSSGALGCWESSQRRWNLTVKVTRQLPGQWRSIGWGNTTRRAVGHQDRVCVRRPQGRKPGGAIGGQHGGERDPTRGTSPSQAVVQTGESTAGPRDGTQHTQGRGRARWKAADAPGKCPGQQEVASAAGSATRRGPGTDRPTGQLPQPGPRPRRSGPARRELLRPLPPSPGSFRALSRCDLCPCFSPATRSAQNNWPFPTLRVQTKPPLTGGGISGVQYANRHIFHEPEALGTPTPTS